MGMNTMDYAHLGRSGLLVSRIGPGTMNSGDATQEADAHRILDRAVDLGVSFIGSADVYGGPQSPDMAQCYGTSE
ncbi:aldo/keto reductase [Corynebacterium variabile]|uniref:aldo/keto reductase n=1 Tax=Corynebacterium variabile TaxID=1727 RepID=UPI003FD64EF4